MPRFHPLKVADIRRETEDAVSVAFEVPESLAKDYQFIQGQYLTLRKEINGEEVRRNYSVCVSPLDGELRVAIKQVPFGRFSTFANQQLQVGDVLDVMTPMGKFYTQLEATNEKNYVGFAGGSGITPVISILKTVLNVEAKSRFILFYGNKGTDSIIFKEELESLKNQYMERLTIHHVFSEERLDSELFNGFITVEKCKQFAKVLFDVEEIDEYFICGPEPMMLAIREALESLGEERKKIHVELFSSPNAPKETAPKAQISSKPASAQEDSLVSVRLDGTTFDFPLPYEGDNILDAALKQGADLPYACKGGVCSTCRARLLEGEVDMEVNYALEPEELKAGFILTCQSHPRSKKIVVDFDDQ